MRLFFVLSVVILACIPIGSALKCPWCVYEPTRRDCLAKQQITCAVNQVCVTTHTKFRDKGEGWKNKCDSQEACAAGKAANPAACKLEDSVFSCVSCCEEDGCVGGAKAAKLSMVTMVTTTLVVMAMNVIWF